MAMTTQEHKLMMTMFTRMYESMGIIANTLTSRGIWTNDDAEAFAHATHFDLEKMEAFASLAFDDYIVFAARLGVDVELEKGEQQSPSQS